MQSAFGVDHGDVEVAKWATPKFASGTLKSAKQAVTSFGSHKGTAYAGKHAKTGLAAKLKPISFGGGAHRGAPAPVTGGAHKAGSHRAGAHKASFFNRNRG